MEDESLWVCNLTELPSFPSFPSFLPSFHSQERGVSKSHVTSHITVANKVIAFLRSTSRSSAQRLHCDRMVGWLRTLEGQIGWALPPPRVKKTPPRGLVYPWVEGMVRGAMDVMNGVVPLTPTSADQIQAALIAQLVLGNEATSPLRLSIIRTLVHPSMVRGVGG